MVDGVAGHGVRRLVVLGQAELPHQAFEAALLLVLHDRAPDHVVPVAAADLARGLLLLPDQGPVFAETVAGDDVDAWCRVATEAMRLQRELGGHQEELLAAGPVRAPPGGLGGLRRGAGRPACCAARRRRAPAGG